jgi:hypothetical protein
MLVTEVNQRAGVRELTVNQEFLDSNGVVVVSLSDDTFNFLEVRRVSASASFYVLEEDFRVFGLGKQVA